MVTVNFSVPPPMSRRETIGDGSEGFLVRCNVRFRDGCQLLLFRGGRDGCSDGLGALRRGVDNVVDDAISVAAYGSKSTLYCRLFYEGLAIAVEVEPEGIRVKDVSLGIRNIGKAIGETVVVQASLHENTKSSNSPALVSMAVFVASEGACMRVRSSRDVREILVQAADIGFVAGRVARNPRRWKCRARRRFG